MISIGNKNIIKKGNKILKKKTKYDGLNTYKVTFTQKDKYHPIQRSVEVQTVDESAARYCVLNEFDSFNNVYEGTGKHRKFIGYLPTGRKITIDNVEEVKDE
jgi:hypothetical protein